MRNRFVRVARYIYARMMYIVLSKQIHILTMNHRMKEAHRATRHKQKLHQILFVK